MEVSKSRNPSEDYYPTLRKRNLVCENSRFFVFLDELTCQGLPYATDYLVVAPKLSAPDLVAGVAVLPVYEGKIGLIKMFRHAVRGESWEIPRGFIEKGKTGEDAALRELAEETGLSCDTNRLHSLGLATSDAGIFAARIHLFAALQCARMRPYSPGELGQGEFRLFESAEIKEMISRSEIQDSYTLVAYYSYMARV